MIATAALHRSLVTLAFAAIIPGRFATVGALSHAFATLIRSLARHLILPAAPAILSSTAGFRVFSICRHVVAARCHAPVCARPIFPAARTRRLRLLGLSLIRASRRG
ncbi:MAG TPA: hypothetical protein VFO39_17970 [Candidatus Sulfotelmatobacter sp.]|nr:hypothetical protein [Candidatus Sulfotelmatobacter sp.]